MRELCSRFRFVGQINAVRQVYIEPVALPGGMLGPLLVRDRSMPPRAERATVVGDHAGDENRVIRRPARVEAADKLSPLGVPEVAMGGERTAAGAVDDRGRTGGVNRLLRHLGTDVGQSIEVRPDQV